MNLRNRIIVSVIITLILELIGWFVIANSIYCKMGTSCPRFKLAFHPYVTFSVVPVFLLVFLIMTFLNYLLNKLKNKSNV